MIRGFELNGYALWEAPVGSFVASPEITLDQVDMEVGNVGIDEAAVLDHAHLQMRNST